MDSHLNHSTPPVTDSTDSLDLLDIGNLLWRNRWTILLIWFGGIVLSVAVAWLQTPMYTAKTTYVAVTSEQSGLGGLASLTGLVGVMPKQPGKIDFEVVLKSRTFAENIINKLNLLPVFLKRYDPKTGELKPPAPSTFDFVGRWMRTIRPEKAIDSAVKKQILNEKALKTLQDSLNITKDQKTGFYTIEISWKDPQIAAAIANQYVHDLDDFFQKNSFTTSKKTRVFLEAQSAKAKKSLEEAEENVKRFNQRYGGFRVEDQASSLVSAIGKIKAEVVTTEVELSVLKDVYSEKNPQVEVAESKRNALQQQLMQLEEGERRSRSGGSYQNIPLKNLPSVGLEYARAMREVAIQQEVYKTLRVQLENARVQETRDSDSIQMIDAATVPLRPSKPKKMMILLVGSIASLGVGIFFVFFKNFINDLLLENRRRLEQKNRSIPV